MSASGRPQPMGRLTTHVLDSAHGCPGHGIKIELYRVEGQQLELIATTLTNHDGRCDQPVLQGEDFRPGVYQLVFNAGDYERAVFDKNATESISKVLYPNDSSEAGRELRLRQEYFFTRCSVADIVRRHLAAGNPVNNLPDKAAIQLNDTHPAIAVAEMMYQLVDHYHLAWDFAWKLVNQIFAYTNHTLMHEALETWPVSMLGRVLPRHLRRHICGAVYRVSSEPQLEKVTSH